MPVSEVSSEDQPNCGVGFRQISAACRDRDSNDERHMSYCRDNLSCCSANNDLSAIAKLFGSSGKEFKLQEKCDVIDGCELGEVEWESDCPVSCGRVEQGGTLTCNGPMRLCKGRLSELGESAPATSRNCVNSELCRWIVDKEFGPCRHPLQCGDWMSFREVKCSGAELAWCAMPTANGSRDAEFAAAVSQSVFFEQGRPTPDLPGQIFAPASSRQCQIRDGCTWVWDEPDTNDIECGSVAFERSIRCNGEEKICQEALHSPQSDEGVEVTKAFTFTGEKCAWRPAGEGECSTKGFEAQGHRCGPGRKQLFWRCISVTGDDSDCAGLARPPSSVPCALTYSCAWDGCPDCVAADAGDAACGVGICVGETKCIVTDGKGGKFGTVSDKYCDGKHKHKVEAGNQCNSRKGCNWVISESLCERTSPPAGCGLDTMRVQAKCPTGRDEDCYWPHREWDSGDGPDDERVHPARELGEQACDDSTSCHFTRGTWGACADLSGVTKESGCDYGVQSRVVECVNTDVRRDWCGADAVSKPTKWRGKQLCKMHSTWSVGDIPQKHGDVSGRTLDICPYHESTVDAEVFPQYYVDFESAQAKLDYKRPALGALTRPGQTQPTLEPPGGTSARCSRFAALMTGGRTAADRGRFPPLLRATRGSPRSGRSLGSPTTRQAMP